MASSTIVNERGITVHRFGYVRMHGLSIAARIHGSPSADTRHHDLVLCLNPYIRVAQVSTDVLY